MKIKTNFKYLFLIFSILILLKCGSAEINYDNFNDSTYIVEKTASNFNSIDPTVSHFYVKGLESLSNTDSYMPIIFNCDLQIAACCRDLELNEKDKDLKVDLHFSKSIGSNCTGAGIFDDNKSINFDYVIENEGKVKLKLFKAKVDYCKCHGDYTSLSKKYKDSIFIFPYKLEFQKVSKKEMSSLRRISKNIRQ